MLNDQAPRHDCSPTSAAAKLARALDYLRTHNIAATERGNRFRYTTAEHGSRVLKPILRRAA